MALITCTSASGSPGVTTTVVGLALTWPRPVIVVDADPSGASQVLAGFFRGLARPGLSELVMAHRHGRLAEELPLRLFPAADSQATFLAGLRSPQQAPTAAGVWDALLDALRALSAVAGADVLVDAGRLGLRGAPEPLLAEADELVLLTRTGLGELAAARGWLPTLAGHTAEPCFVLVDTGRPYTAADVAHDLGVQVLGTLPWDPPAARWWSHGEPHRRLDRSPLFKAIHALGDTLRGTADPDLQAAQTEEAVRS